MKWIAMILPAALALGVAGSQPALAHCHHHHHHCWNNAALNNAAYYNGYNNPAAYTGYNTGYYGNGYVNPTAYGYGYGAPVSTRLRSFLGNL